MAPRQALRARRPALGPLGPISALLLLLGLSACREPEPIVELPPRAIRWMKVSAAVPAEQRVISGIVTAVDTTSLAFEVGGTVVQVAANLGDRVERDQVLARLDPEPFELAVADAEAALARAIAQHAADRANYERTRVLFDADVASKQELDRDIARRDSTGSQVEALRARLSLAQRDLRRSILRAPFKGSISVRSIERAMKVASGEVVFEMDSEESGLRVEVQMPETLIARVEQGSRVAVSFPSISAGSGESEVATTEAVVTEVGTRARTGNAFQVRANLLNAPEGLRPGMTAEVRFSLPKIEVERLGIDGFLVPFAAVRIGRGQDVSVFVYDESSSSVRLRPVQTGGVRDNDVAVMSGLEDGEIIATAGVSFLRDGQTVRLLQRGQEAALR